jgi:hypothetical protein
MVRNKFSSLGLYLSMLAALLCSAGNVSAQVLYGSIVGNVKDQSDASVGGATVTITSKATNQTRTTTTNEAGVYVFSSVPAETYDVKVTMQGFQSVTKSDVTVRINTVARADFSLQVGAVTESIQVSAAAATLQTDRSDVRLEVNASAFQNVPLPPGRNYQFILGYMPGVTPPRNAHSVPSNPSRALQYNVNGTSSSSNNVRIDGASSTNVWLPHVSAYVPALESIETVNIATSSFDAEQGLAGGSAVNVQIKSGTNEIHGSAFEYHNNNKTKAKPWIFSPTQRNPKTVYNQFGGTVGGPIIKNKLFYFLSYEGTLDRQFAARFVSVPLAAMKRGDMSGQTAPLFDPATGNAMTGVGRVPFAGNQIPASRIHPVSARLNALLPNPTDPGIANNYFASGAYSFDRHTFDTKTTWNVTSKLNLYARLSYLQYDMNNPQIFGDALGGDQVSAAGGNPGLGFGHTWSSTLALNYVATPNLVIDGYFGHTLMDTNVEQSRLDEKIGLDVLRLPGTNGTRRFEGGWPRFDVAGFTPMGVPNAFMPYYRHDPVFQYAGNVSWNKGSHNIRFGFDLYRQHLNHSQPEFPGASHGAQGGFSFAGNPTIAPGTSASQYHNYGGFLLGLPTTVGKILQVGDEYTTRYWARSFYARDQWQVSRKLTLNYGARFEMFPLPNRADRGMERYDFNLNKMLICGVGTVPADCGVSQRGNFVAPRIGLAYRLSDTFVLRAGYGITIDPYSLARPLRTNHPVLLALNITSPTGFAWARRLEEGIPPLTAPSLGNGVIDVPSTVAVNTLGENFQRGYVQSWNFTLQKQLKFGFTGQVGYVATRQIRQLGFLDLNVAPVGGGNAGRPLNRRFGRVERTAVVQGIGNTQYNSLQAMLERRLSANWHFGAAYTWSKSLGICCADNSDGSPAIHLAEFYSLNRSVTGLFLPHVFSLNSSYRLPLGKGQRWLSQNKAAHWIAGGWQINGIFASIAGGPMWVTAPGQSLNAIGNTQRADQLKPTVQKIGGAGRGQSFFDPLAFRPVTEVRFGNHGFNSLRGPGAVNLDLGIFRDFQVTERIKIQFRAEAFNSTNTPHLNNPGTNVGGLVLNADGSVRTLGGFTEILSTRGTGREGIDERVFRFGLRLSF